MRNTPEEAWEALMDRRRTYYDQWSAVYSGDRRSLARTGDRDSFWRRPGKAKLHVPIAADIAAISAELLFGEEVRFQISCVTGFGDPAEKNRRLSEIASRSGLQARLSEAAESAAALGEVFLKLSWTDASDIPLIQVRQADESCPEYGPEGLSGMHFFQTCRTDPRKGTVWRVWEGYEPGLIHMRLFRGTALELGEEEEEGKLADMGYTGEIEVPVDDLLAVHIPNLRPNRLMRSGNMGRSDLEGLRGLMDALDETYTSWMRDIRLAKSRLIVPAEYLRRRPQDLFREGQYTYEFDEDVETLVALDIDTSRAGTGQIIPSQFQIRTQEHLATCEHLIRSIVSLAGYSPQTFGLDISGRAESGTALHMRERKSYSTRGKKENYWKQPLEQLLTGMVRLDGELFSGLFDADDTVSVVFPAPVVSDLSTTASAVRLLREAGLLSREEGIGMVHPDWVKDMVTEEAERIGKEGEDAQRTR